LLSLLRQRLQSITRNIYIVRYIPEQTEELYDILVDGVTVVHIELPRDVSSREIVFEKSGLKEYLEARIHITKPNRRKLELALELAQR
jgi:thiamine pyrophosphate-dependent acetolactate synthase large subunit-like protein